MFSACSIRSLFITTLSLLMWQSGGWFASANPAFNTATISQGMATFTPSGSQLTITAANNTYINWTSFNIDAGETTTFVQPSSSSLVWNHIGDANPSQIFGTLNANGYVVLQNQSGFYIGGKASISAHGLIMTTTPTPMPNLSSGGAWSFNTPPPAANIINYGQINITGGGSAFLIASDIENRSGIDNQNNNSVGTISAPGGKIGLYAGEKVLVSTSPDGRGLSTEVTLPEGMVNNQGQLTADGGSIALNAQTVNQGGLIQANSAQNVNGTIELVASDAVNLNANSAVSAQGDSTGTSSGGSVTIQSGNTFSDQAGSIINVSGGAQGGASGQVEISAPQMSALNTIINGQANAGYASSSLSINTANNISLNSDGNPATGSLSLDVNSLSSGFSQISLQTSDNIELSSQWTLATKSGVIGVLSLLAGNTITLDNGSGIGVDAGRITLNAATVNQNGMLQANSIKNANGVIEIDASDSLNLGANSIISANGDSTASSASPGGFMVLNAGNNTFADTSGSTISVSGANGGQNGVVEIFGNGASAGTIQSSYGSPYAFLINPYDITLSSSATTIGSNPTLNIGALSSYSQIDLHSLDNIELNSSWTLTDPGVAATLNLTAGNNIILDDGPSIIAGNNWSVNLTAGAQLPSGSLPTSGNDGIYLNGSSYIQAKNGNMGNLPTISLFAPNEVILGSGAVRTIGGGSINVTTLYGDVNTGTGTSGFNYISEAPYFSPFSSRGSSFGTGTSLSGISTAGGGNVTINAGGDVISYLPTGIEPGDNSVAGDAGTGAFGSQPGNVTINAGGSVYGHYVVVNGTGTINASQNIGSSSQNVALSLVTGGWNLDALNGNIFLQEVRNPNGVFNDSDNYGSGGTHLFDYDPSASVSLTAGIGVYLGPTAAGNNGPTAAPGNLPRTSDVIVNGTSTMPIILPPTLNISAGFGGVTLEDNIILFPSKDGNGGLQITTTDGGNFISGENGNAVSTYQLIMSDSSQTYWMSSFTFGSMDRGSTPSELNNYDPALINIAGSMNNIVLQTTKETQITVGGDMTGCSFYGENLHAADVTSITVAGQIFNPGSFNYVTLNQGIQNVPLADLPPDTLNNWQTLLTLAVDPAKIAAQTIPAGIDPSQYATYVVQDLLFGDSLQSSFAYDPTTQTLTFIGSMSQPILNALDKPLTVLVYGPNGYPVVDENPNDASYGHFETTTINWINPTTDPNAISTLYTESQGAPSLGNSGGGYVIGGTGEFDVTAGSISLGNSYGILSLGNGQLVGENYSYLTSDLQTQPGATINITVGNDITVNGVTTPSLNMPSSTIAALGGGDVNVTSTGGSMDLGSQYLVQFEGQIMTRDNLGLGIYTSGGGNVNVTALGDINVDSSRIATFDGGDISIESFTGDVNAGSGGDVAIPVNVFSPQAGFLNQPFEYVYANGIVAQTLVNASQVPDSATVPGNITVLTPQGSIFASQGGILQEALNGNVSAGPTIDLEAGTPGPDGFGSSDTPVYVGDINLGDSGVIGGTVNVKATGTITGLVISRQNSDVTAPTVGSLTVLAGGTANVSAQNSGSGSGITIIGGQGVNASGIGSGATLLGQNVSVNGGAAQSTLGSSATATSTSQSAAGTASNDAKQQVASDNSEDDDQNKKKHPTLQRMKRVTVILPKAS